MSLLTDYMEKEIIGKYCIVRCYVSGVHVGIIKMYDSQIRHAVIKDSRCIWGWSGRFTLYEISEQGLDDAKLTIVKDEIIVTDVVEILPVSIKAEKMLRDMETYVP